MHGQTPSLAPELWNLSTVVVLCGLMGWMGRLVRLMLTYFEAQFSIQQNAVIHLEKLGPSLHVLRLASMWHFHQLLRTQLQVASTRMKRVRVSSELVASSVKLLESADEDGMRLSVEVKSTTKCFVQVFWNVKASALDGTCQGATATSTTVDWPRKRRLQLVDAVLPTRAARTAIHAVRSLPGKFYDMDIMNTPHRLLDEETGKDNGYTGDRVLSSPKAGRTGLCLARFLAGSNSFRSCSVMERRQDGGVNEYVAPIPDDVLANAEAEEAIQSSVVATDCDSERPPAPSGDGSRYSCVVAIGSSAFFESAAVAKSPLGFGMRRRSSSSQELDAEEQEAVCQCVAIDFLPTPAKPHRAPAIVKKLLFTATDVFSSQEIFGRGAGGECVICLERAPAAVLLPCRHFCVCRTCLEEIDQCPICRAKFSTYACYDQDDGNSSNSALQVS